ncbi:Cd(II)/Pb(II)-responsive transcriptional regulator [Sphingomonas metalli]|uniref:Cd(II)/Pb(II)-responsive transcriptional regulator n=1 Tax=Sphingomonas metalli TaxID=1779358 RepID=A0A916WZ29_9SPHN|nr:helix-turn-helix domain-containing protein [Sphingomonas metalli]GGB43580.1 Cd(II)/Pb(II)-responsive transcriptional regulator [Sphingomonas metalli]
MKIGEIASRIGLKIETIRFYETEGLIAPPARTSGNYRIYNRAHLDRLSFIKRSRDLGFTLDQVRDLLRLADNRGSSCTEVDVIAGHHVAEIDRKLADLTALRTELVRSLECCERATIAECRIIEALSPRSRASAAHDD